MSMPAVAVSTTFLAQSSLPVAASNATTVSEPRVPKTFPHPTVAPKFWKETREQPETQQRLAAARLLGRSIRLMQRTLTTESELGSCAVHRTRTIVLQRSSR